MRTHSTVEPDGAAWRRQAEVFHEAALALAHAHDPATLAGIVRQIARLDGFRVGQAFVASPGQRRLIWCSAWHAGAPELEAFVERTRQLGFAEAFSPSSAALRDRSTRIVNTPEAPLHAPRRDVAARAGLRAGFAVPVIVRGHVVAVLEFHRADPILENDSAVLLAEALAAQFATVVALRMTEAERERLADHERSARRQILEANEELAWLRSALDQPGQSRDLAQGLLAARESERREISRDLHDEVGQVVAAVKLSLEPSDGRSEILGSALGALMQRIRNLSQRLRPPMLEDLGLVPTLEWHVRKFSEQTGVRVGFRPLGTCGRFHPDLEMALYRVVQEALTNAAKHSAVREASVVLRAGPEGIGIRIRDRGMGFDTGHASTGGTGIASMKERLKPFRGQLELKSTIGRGTTVTATVPFNDRGEYHDRSHHGRRRRRPQNIA